MRAASSYSALLQVGCGKQNNGHVIILHRPVCFHHCLLCWQPGVHLIDEALPGGELTHQLYGRIIWIEAHRVRIMYHLGFRWVL